MSVLIEAVCLVVPRRVLDVSFPGGTDAFLADAEAREGVRFAVADGALTSVSAYDPEVLVAIADTLVGHGIVWADEGGACELVAVDQQLGLALPCDWLEIERHGHGFTRAWHTSGTPGELVAPDGWRLKTSWDLTRSDVRDGNEDWLQLASDENNLETWLDFSTGRMQQALAETPRVLAVQPGTGAAPRVPGLGQALGDVRAVLGRVEIPYTIDLEQRRVVIPFATEDIDRVQLMVSSTLRGLAMRCEGVLPDRIPPDDMTLVGDLARALKASNADCSLTLDPETRSAHVMMTSTYGGTVEERLEYAERALGYAADQAGRVHAAITLARCGAPLEACVRPVIEARRNRTAAC